MDNMQKPPIGIMPRNIFIIKLDDLVRERGGIHLPYFQKKRKVELQNAIMRYLCSDYEPDSRWIQEYNELCSALGVKPLDFEI